MVPALSPSRVTNQVPLTPLVIWYSVAVAEEEVADSKVASFTSEAVGAHTRKVVAVLV
ncbi:unannotated protein [freshwater metagenome]|uniref:Unannotated protein n=1 Tax=freshwater metagenome TaxID=449393 RepID=A0A6J6HW71_9ZZZZ